MDHASICSNSKSSSNVLDLPTDAHLPPPGPDHFVARRALWTRPTAASRLDQATSPSCVKLEGLLDQPGALESPDIWDAGLSNIWKSLIAGGRLRSFLPLRAVVCDMSAYPFVSLITLGQDLVCWLA
jgi:hypothetical protein